MYGRGNIGVATVNLVDAALSAEKDLETFFEILENRLDIAKEIGVFRYNKLKGVKANVAPIMWQHGAVARLKPDDYIIDAIDARKFTVSIGFIGLHETVKALIGETLTSKKGKELGLKIMQYIENYKDRAKEETGLWFAVYSTPSESLAGRFAEKLKIKFGEVEGITDKGWLTNSYHTDIQEEINAFDKLALEQQFAKHTLGGTITYIETYNMENNIPAVMQLLEFMYENNIYAEINTESDVCSTCGFSGAIDIDRETLEWVCPQCGERDDRNLSVVRRTCGYISENKWSKGRLLDIINRVKHI